MVLVPFSLLRTVHGISDQDLDDIRLFMRGAVFCWLRNHPDQWFAVHDLVGGLVNDWHGTPLRMLRDLSDARHPEDEEAAHDEAARNLGWIVKSMLHAEERTFRTCRGEIAREYLWVQHPVAGMGTEADDQTEPAGDDDLP
jgi:hypothetical protein